MIKINIHSTICLTILLLFSLSIQAQKKLLIYTHNGEGYVHENISASVVALEKLAKENNYEYYTTDDPVYFTKKNLASFDCIIFSNTNNEAFDEQAQKDAFQSYIQNGGGFVGIHSASGSERQWPWFWQMLGAKFVYHPPLQSFELKVIDPDHPSTSFLNDIWTWEDEPYFLDHLNPDIKIVLAADLNTIEDDKKDDYPGTTFYHYAPIAWYHEFDGGRQFYTALGHKPAYYEDPNYLKHILGGLKWVLEEE